MSQTNTGSAPQPRGQSRLNRFICRLAGSPFGVLMGGPVVIRYEGRVSGLPRQLPVNAWPIEGGYLIRVGKPERKTWWRNFRSAWPIEVLKRGRVIRGTGLAVMGDTERGRQIAADYFSDHRGAAKRAGLPRLPKGERRAPDAVSAAAKDGVFMVVTPGE